MNICFFSAWGWGEKGRKPARGDPGRPFLLSTLTRASVIECSFPVTDPAQRGPFMGSPARQSGHCSSSGPLNSSSKPLTQQLPGLGRRAGRGPVGGGTRTRACNKRVGGGKGEPLALLRLPARAGGGGSCTRLRRRWAWDPGPRQGALISLRLPRSGRNVLPQMTGGALYGLLWRLEARAPPSSVAQGLSAWV